MHKMSSPILQKGGEGECDLGVVAAKGVGAGLYVCMKIMGKRGLMWTWKLGYEFCIKLHIIKLASVMTFLLVSDLSIYPHIRVPGYQSKYLFSQITGNIDFGCLHCAS